MEIIVTQKDGCFVAYLKDRSSVWACGKTKKDAVCNLFFDHTEIFDVSIKNI